MTKRALYWTFIPALCATLYFLVLSALPYAKHISDLALLLEQLALCTVLVGAILIAKQAKQAGLTKRFGFSWLWIAGPIWLGILTPLGLAFPNIIAHPANAVLWICASIFIGLNEEILFRGLMLNGLFKLKGPMWGAIISSVAFGLLHSINGLFGAEVIFLLAQMAVAFGTGMVLCAVTLRAGSIWPAVFLHFATDAVGLSALGGYQNAIHSPEAAAGMLTLGALGAIWGSVWIWYLKRRGKIRLGGYSEV